MACSLELASWRGKRLGVDRILILDQLGKGALLLPIDAIIIWECEISRLPPHSLRKNRVAVGIIIFFVWHFLGDLGIG